MRATLVADHMVATMRLLTSRIALWTRASVQFHVLLAGYFFIRQLRSPFRIANEEFPVPASFADLAEGEGAFSADSKSIGGRYRFVRTSDHFLRWIDLAFVIRLAIDIPIKRFSLFGSSSTLAPLAWAVDCVSIRF